MPIQQMLLGGGAAPYPDVDSLFRTYKFTGNEYSETVQMLENESGSGYTSGEGAAVWHWKEWGNDPYYFDTNDVAGETLVPAEESPQYTGWSNSFEGWDANKHNFYLGNNNGWASNGGSYAGWIFRKYAKFMDMGEFTKSNNNAQTFNHSLGTTPYFLMVKRINNTTNAGWNEWMGWISSEGATKYLAMNHSGALQTSTHAWNDTNPTSTQFTLGQYFVSGTYKYWIWPQYGEHINCGYYNGSSSNVTVMTSSDGTAGKAWKPQAITIRRLDAGEPWLWFDTKRGLATNSQSAKYMNSNSGDGGSNRVNLTSTGFTALSGNTYQNGAGNKYFYMAIREV